MKTPSGNSLFETDCNNDHKTNKPMKRTFFTFLLVFLAAFAWAQQVHHGESFELDEPVQPIGHDEYRATSHISLMPGFSSSPEIGTSLLLTISHTGLQANTATILAYPNPAKDILNIGLQGQPLAKQVGVQIIDATGRVCMEHHIAGLGERLVLDISRLEPGLYLYRINGMEKEPLKGKFIKQ